MDLAGSGLCIGIRSLQYLHQEGQRIHPSHPRWSHSPDCCGFVWHPTPYLYRCSRWDGYLAIRSIGDHVEHPCRRFRGICGDAEFFRDGYGSPGHTSHSDCDWRLRHVWLCSRCGLVEWNVGVPGLDWCCIGCCRYCFSCHWPLVAYGRVIFNTGIFEFLFCTVHFSRFFLSCIVNRMNGIQQIKKKFVYLPFIFRPLNETFPFTWPMFYFVAFTSNLFCLNYLRYQVNIAVIRSQKIISQLLIVIVIFRGETKAIHNVTYTFSKINYCQ